MLNNFIYAQTKDLFLEKLNAGEVIDEAIVFIEDTKEIGNHGTYFDCSTVDLSHIETSVANVQTEISTISTEKLDKSVAESTYATKEEAEEIKWVVGITFYVGNNAYTAEEGMTWEEFVLQNTHLMWTVTGNKIITCGGASVYDCDNNTAVKPQDVIQTEGNYETRGGGNVGQ